MASNSSTSQISSASSPTASVSFSSTTDISGLTTTEIASFTANDLASFSTPQIRQFNNAQVEAISPNALSGFTGIIGEFTSTQIGALTVSQVASFTATEAEALTKAKLAAMSTQQLSSISVSAFEALGAGRVASLTTTQISALTVGEIDTLSVRKLSLLSGAQIAAINSQALASLGVKRIGSLSAAQVSALTTAQVAALTTAELTGLTKSTPLTPAQVAAMTPDQLNQLGGAVISNFSPSLLNGDQYAYLNSTTVSDLSTNFFSQMSTSDLDALSTTAVSAITTSQLAALTSTQLTSFSAAQISAMNTAQIDMISAVNPLIVQAALLAGNGVLGYDGALAVLQSVENAGFNATTFSELQSLAQKMQSTDDPAVGFGANAIPTLGSANQLFDNVVLGDAENAVYYGGSNQATPLGNLTSQSTQAQFETLVNKWFLGSDMPSLQSDVNGDTLNASYVQSSLPLYGSSGAPQMSDVVGGSLSDSALLAGIAETAFQDPDYLQQLITDNGNGTYTVQLPAEFGSTFTTVNNQLPVGLDGSVLASASASTGDWVDILEKAAAQNAVDISSSLGDPKNQLGNTVAALTLPGYADDQVSLYGGEMFYQQSLYNLGSSDITQALTSANQSFSDGLNVILQLGNHYEAVTAINANAGTLNVYDPSSGKSGQVTLTPSSMSVDDALYFSMVPGRAAVLA